MPVPVYVKLTNRWAYIDERRLDGKTVSGGFDARNILSTFFRFHPPGYFFSPLFRQKAWDGYIKLYQKGKIPAGLFLAQRKEVEAKSSLKFSISDERVLPRFNDYVYAPSDEKYRFQKECVDAMIKASKTGGLILSATGTGKTFIAAQYFKKLVGYGCFIVDELALLDQAREELSDRLGERVGFIGDMKFRPRRITVATVQTLFLHRNDPAFQTWLQALEVLMIDELHAMLNNRNRTFVESIQPKTVFGLTASLQLQKIAVKMRSMAISGPVIYEYPLIQGVEDKVLSPGIGVGVDLVREGMDKKYDVTWRYEKMIVRSKKRNSCIEALVREAYERGYFTIVLVDWIKHLKRLSKRLADIPHEVIYGARKTWERTAARKDFDKGKFRLILANKVFKKGTNIKRVDVMIDGASRKNPNDTMQKYGRGVRLHNDKGGLLYFDIGDKGPRGITKQQDGYNQYQRHTRSRRRVLKGMGVEVLQFDWRDNANEIFDEAESKLRKVVKCWKKGGKHAGRPQ